MSLSANCFTARAVWVNKLGNLTQTAVSGDLFAVIRQLIDHMHTKTRFKGIKLNSKVVEGWLGELEHLQLLVIAKAPADQCVDEELLILGPDASKDDEEKARRKHFPHARRVRIKYCILLKEVEEL